MFSYLNADNLFDKYEDSKKYMEELTEEFPEYARIAQNKPKKNLPKQYPKTTDGTTASVIRKTPRRIIQQVPTGMVVSKEDDWLGVVASYIYRDRILPKTDDGYELIQKCWNVVERGLTFGFAASWTSWVQKGADFSTDIKIVYWGDIFFQRGAISGYNSKYTFMRTWWTEEDVDQIIYQEKKELKKAKKEGYEYVSGFDIQNLKKIKKSYVSKDEQASTPTDDKLGDAKGIEIVTAIQHGIGSQIFTFNPAENVIIRTQTSEDPRGRGWLDFFYADTDGINPCGRGIVDLIGPLQNLIDSDMQMYQYNRALLLGPPMLKYGNFNKSRVKFVPNIIIDMGNDPNARLETLKIDSSAINQYPELYGLQKSQLLNLVSSPDTSISASVGNPGFSKTDAGVKSIQAAVSVDDNYVQKMFETWFANVSESLINRWFVERSGEEELQLDEDTANKLRKLAEEGKFDIQLLSEDNKILIDYDTATPALNFHVDASTSKVKDDATKAEGLSNLIERVDASLSLRQLVPTDKLATAYNRFIDALGLEDPEELKIDIKQLKAEMEQAKQQAKLKAQQAQTQAQAPQPQMMTEMPQETGVEPQLEEEMPMSQNNDEAFAAALFQLGASDPEIEAAMAMRGRDISDEEILAIIGASDEEVMGVR